MNRMICFIRLGSFLASFSIIWRTIVENIIWFGLVWFGLINPFKFKGK
jgi:hypothetical protein